MTRLSLNRPLGAATPAGLAHVVLALLIACPVLQPTYAWAQSEAPATEPVAPTQPKMPKAPKQPREPAAALPPRAPKPPRPVGGSRLDGRLPDPDKLPKVDLELDDEPIGEALEKLAEQTGWSLLVTTNRIDEPIKLRMKQVPADQALDALLSAGKLHARFHRNTLSVFSNPNGDEDDEGEIGGAETEVDVGLPDVEDQIDNAERTSQGEDLEIGEEEVVDSAVATGGNLIVRGRIRNDAVAVGGNVTMKPGSHVDGDAVAIGGKVTVERGAVLRGNRTSFGGGLGGLMKAITKSKANKIQVRGDGDDDDEKHSRHRDDHDSWFFEPGGAMLRGFLGFLLCLLFIGFVPERLTEVRTMLTRRAQYAGVAGILLGLTFLPVLTMLTLTLVGIPLVPVVAVMFVIAMAMGYVVIAQWIGERVPVLQNRKTPLSVCAIGVLVLTFFDFFPYVGFFAIGCACLFAAGGVILTRYGKPGATDGLAPTIIG